jgi:hypothetical protein
LSVSAGGKEDFTAEDAKERRGKTGSDDVAKLMKAA